MSFTWRTLLELADHLRISSHPNIDGEAFQRTSISRSYYGAYNTSVEWIENKKLATIPKNGDAHKKVANVLRASNIPEVKRAGFKLASLRGKRWQADYNYIPQINFSAEAQTALNDATYICDTIDAQS